MDIQSHNVIPEIPEPFECMWENCNFNFTSAQDFYWHVHGHAISVDNGPTKLYQCSWKGEAILYVKPFQEFVIFEQFKKIFLSE